MKLSLYLNPQTSGPANDAAVLRASIEQVERAEASGFAAVYLTEHHTTGYNVFSDPVVFGAYLARFVKQMWLGFSVAVLPLHHPVRFATQCALLDNLMDGRFMAGIGPGGGPLETAAFGVNPADRRPLTDEATEVILGAWCGDFRHKGRYFDVAVERIIPAPVTQPHPHLARAAVSLASIEATARRGWPVLLGRYGVEKMRECVAAYRSVLEREADERDVAFCVDWISALKVIHVGESDEAAMVEVEPALRRYLIQAAKANTADYINEQQADEMIDDFIARATIIGSARTVADRILEYADAGVTNLMAWTYFGEMDPAASMRSLGRLADDVLPRVASAVGSRR